MTRAANDETPGTPSDQGSRPPQPDVIQPDQDTRRVAVLTEDGHRRPGAAAAFVPGTSGPTRPTWVPWPRMP